MQAVILKITYNRKTGKKIHKEITEMIEVDEDEYYKPLVKILGDGFLKKWNDGKFSV